MVRNFQRPRLVKLLRAVALLLEKSPLSGVEIMAGIGEVPEDTRRLDETQKRAFERLKDDLLKLGVHLEKRAGAEEFVRKDGGQGATYDTTLYSVRKGRYSLKDPHLSREEILALHLLRQALSAEKGFPLRANLAQAFQKLSAVAPLKFPDAQDKPLPIAESAPAKHSPEVLDRLILSGAQRVTVGFHYTAFHSDTHRQRKVRPYGFFTRRGIWYLVGGDVEDDQTKVFRISRIDASKKVQTFPHETFEVPASFRLRDYSEVPPWRFQPENPIEQVTIEIDREEFWRVEESCRRDGQIEETSSGFLWRVEVQSYPPLIKWLLPLGASVQPVSPPLFVTHYRETVESILAQYEVAE